MESWPEFPHTHFHMDFTSGIGVVSLLYVNPKKCALSEKLLGKKNVTLNRPSSHGHTGNLKPF
jgi:hypothetical protein